MKAAEFARDWRALDEQRRRALRQRETFDVNAAGRALLAHPRGGRGVGKGLAPPAVTVVGPESVNLGEIVRLTGTSVNVASGGAYLASDTIAYQSGFVGVTAAGTDVTLPYDATYAVELVFAWDSYLRGGKVEVEVAGTVERTITDPGLGQRFSHTFLLDGNAADVVKVKVTQTSGAVQAGSWTLAVAVVEPAARRLGPEGSTDLVIAGGNRAGASLKTVLAYNFVSGTWSSLASLPYTQRDHGIGYGAGKVVVFGGQPGTDHPDYPTDQTARVYVYDPVADSWSAGTSMSTARRFVFCGSQDDIIYYGGGNDTSGTAEWWKYDPATDTHTQLTDMPGARAPAACVSDGTYIWVVGGDQPGLVSNPTATVWRYDPAGDSWATGFTAVPSAFTRSNVGHHDGKLYLTTSQHVYDIAADSWSATSKNANHGAGWCVPIGDDGEIAQFLGSAASESKNATSGTWETDITAPSEGNGRGEVYGLGLLVDD